MAANTSRLPATHPLTAELAAVRAQLSQYQHAAHQTAIQLQGSRLELALNKEQNVILRQQVENIKQELEILR
jgi:hypothetical protein